MGQSTEVSSSLLSDLFSPICYSSQFVSTGRQETWHSKYVQLVLALQAAKRGSFIRDKLKVETYNL